MKITNIFCVLILWTFVIKSSHPNATKYQKWSGGFTGSVMTQTHSDTIIGCLSICEANECQASTYISETRVCEVYSNVTLHEAGSTQEQEMLYVKDGVLENHLQAKVSL